MATTVVILAGGMSRRMGKDKATLRFGALSLLDHMIALAEEALGKKAIHIWVSGAREGYRVIPDDLPAQGPLGGIRSSLEYFLRLPFERQPRQALFLPVDMPLLTSRSIRDLFRGLDGNTACAFEGFELPFGCEVSDFTARAAEAALRSPTASSRSIGHFLAKLDVVRLALPKDHGPIEFSNVNTPHEWSRVEGSRVPT